MYKFLKEITMLAKYWKKFGLFILIVACIFNVMTKIVRKTSLKSELEATATYVNQEENKNLNEELEKK